MCVSLSLGLSISILLFLIVSVSVPCVAPFIYLSLYFSIFLPVSQPVSTFLFVYVCLCLSVSVCMSTRRWLNSTLETAWVRGSVASLTVQSTRGSLRLQIIETTVRRNSFAQPWLTKVCNTYLSLFNCSVTILFMNHEDALPRYSPFSRPWQIRPEYDQSRSSFVLHSLHGRLLDGYNG